MLCTSGGDHSKMLMDGPFLEVSSYPKSVIIIRQEVLICLDLQMGMDL